MINADKLNGQRGEKWKERAETGNVRLFVPAEAMDYYDANGAAWGVKGTGSYDVYIPFRNQTFWDYAFTKIRIPRPIHPVDAGSIVFSIIWHASAAGGGQACRWRIDTQPRTNNQDMEAAGGVTAAEVAANSSAAAQGMVTTQMLTLTGRTVEDFILVRISRNGGHASDTLAQDARLDAMFVEYLGLWR